jgi:hypothetical protein
MGKLNSATGAGLDYIVPPGGSDAPRALRRRFDRGGSTCDGQGLGGLRIARRRLRSPLESARIGDAADGLDSGRISRVNDSAMRSGMRAGQPVADVVERLRAFTS